MNQYQHTYQTPIAFGGGWDDGRRGPAEIQILRTGSFDSAQGEFDVTPDDLLNMVNNFNGNARRIELCINENHDIGGEALAWIKKVYTINSDNELWASVSWTDEGNKKIGSKEYKYLSAEFSFDYTDNETGETFGPTLLGAAVTNWPVVKAMQPMFLSEKGANMIPKKDKSIDDLAVKFAELEENYTRLSEAVKTKDAELTKLSSEVKTLSEANETLKTEKALSEKNADFDKMMGEGKVCEAQRAAYLSNDMAEFVKNAELPNLKAQSTGNGVIESKNSDPEVEITKLASKMADETKRTLSECIGDVLRANPKLAKEYNEKFQSA